MTCYIESMTMNMLATAATLSDHDLLARVSSLVQRERESSVELVAHLGELDSRTILAAKGYSSTFAYCTEALRLSEDATIPESAWPGPPVSSR